MWVNTPQAFGRGMQKDDRAATDIQPANVPKFLC